MVSITGHYNCALELIYDSLLNFVLFRLFIWVPLSFLDKSGSLLINQIKTMVNWQVFGDIVDNQIKPALEYPWRCEKSGPSLNCVVKRLGLWWHKETRISSNLAQLWVAHLGFDDRVNEIECKRMIFHLHWIKVIQSKLRHSLNSDCEFSTKIGLFCFKINSFIKSCRWKNIIADANVIDKDTF